MSFKPPPYLSIQAGRIAQAFSMGDLSDCNYVFCWSKVWLNLPGQPDYDPTWPWIAKVRSDGQVAANRFQYVDNV